MKILKTRTIARLVSMLNKISTMKKLNWITGILIVLIFTACEKEYSLENTGGPNELIVGVNCRISKIVYTDTAAKLGLGSIAAAINSLNIVTKITKFDSLSNTIEFITPTIIYVSDTVYINADEYFVVDFNKRISKLHGLSDPTDPFSPQFDVQYLYSALGYLTTKVYTFTAFPVFPFYRVDYTYTNGNLTKMTGTDMFSNELIIDASINYYTNIIPKRYIYIFPDEKNYPFFNQFYNFGVRSFNAVKDIKIRNYDPGNVVRDSTFSTFSNYIMSRDTYVLSVQMAGDAQPCIPAPKGKLSFSYKCK
jgi:hypothetical protein